MLLLVKLLCLGNRLGRATTWTDVPAVALSLVDVAAHAMVTSGSVDKGLAIAAFASVALPLTVIASTTMFALSFG